MSEAVVLDTNILVRAVLSKAFLGDNILRKTVSGGRYLVYGAKQFEELVEVLGYERIRRKYLINDEEMSKLGKWVMKSKEVEPVVVELCRDPDDNYMIGLALKVAKNKKAFLVTGDKDVLVLNGKVKNVEILTPGEFLKL